LKPFLASAALAAAVACNRGANVWSCEVPPARSCVQWVGDPEQNEEVAQESCRNVGGIVHEDVCPIDDTVFGRCDSGFSSTIYYGRRDLQSVRLRCSAVGGTWHGARGR
jgi:hypothetical protein